MKPDFFIIGAQKCGTTSLYNWLKSHPQIFMPENKEPHYFAEIDLVANKRISDTLNNVINSEIEYLDLFSLATCDQIKGEASPSYLWGLDVASKINVFNSNSKFIALLRDPVERAYSEYLMFVAAGLETSDFNSAIKYTKTQSTPKWGAGPMYIELGKYGGQLKRYYDTFDASQIIVFTNTELATTPEITVEQISNFLEIDNEFWRNFDFSRNIYHKGGLPRNYLSKILLKSQLARSLGRLLIPRKLRPVFTERVMIKNGMKDEISLEVKQIIWEFCEKEVLLVEELVGKKMPELWNSYPSYQ